jgi:hypothetical protein
MGYIHHYYYLFGSLPNIWLPMDHLLFPSLIQAKMAAHGWNNPALKNWLTNFGRAVVGAIQLATKFDDYGWAMAI